MGPRAGLEGCEKSRPPPPPPPPPPNRVYIYTHTHVLCTSSALVSLSWLSCILPFCLYVKHKHPLCTSSVLLSLSSLSWLLPLSLQYATQTSMPPAGFEPAISASDWPQIVPLDRSATGIDIHSPGRPQPVECRYTNWAIVARLTLCLRLQGCVFSKHVRSGTYKKVAQVFHCR